MQRLNVYQSRRSVGKIHLVTICGKENFFHSAVQSAVRPITWFHFSLSKLSPSRWLKKNLKKKELTKAAVNKRRLSWMAALSQSARKILASFQKFTRHSQQRRRNRNSDHRSLLRVDAYLPIIHKFYYSLSLFFCLTYTPSAHYT